MLGSLAPFVASIAFLPLLCGCGGERGSAPAGGAAPVRVFAAASLGPFLAAAAPAFTGETKLVLETTTGATSTLARQVGAGAPADVFLAAEPRWIDELEAQDRLQGGTRREIARGALVLVAPADRAFVFDFESGASLADAFSGHLAIGDPEHVPVGRYARQALERASAWDGLVNRLAGAPDARATLALVERGECAAGIVYASDALSSTRVVAVCAVPPGLHDPVVYTGALVAGGPCEGARRFLDWLGEPQARELLVRHGFLVVEAP